MSATLVTGATGFTGSNLCRRLIREGHRVVAFVRESPRVAPLREQGVECRVLDIRNRAEVRDSFDGIDRVFHIAAAYRTEHSDLGEFTRINVDATRHLLEVARSAQVKRFVHCSTVGVHGGIEDPPVDETYRFAPGDHYQVSKLEGELLASQAFVAGLPGVVVRPGAIYGPGDTRFLKLFRPIAKGRFVMIGSGQVFYHMTYIDDLVDGFILCGEIPEAVGEIFTIAGARHATLQELVETIADVLGAKPPRLRIPYGPVHVASVLCEKLCRAVKVSPPLYPRRVEFFKLNRAFTIDKARRVLGYEPKVDLREGISRTAAWYREQGLI